LRNALDVLESELKEEPENHQKTVQALVDTGTHWLVISEELRRELGLRIKGKRGASLANQERIVCEQTDGVEICWKDRYTILPALIIPNRPYVLLGALPLEAMDLIVDPVREKLTGAHGDEWINEI